MPQEGSKKRKVAPLVSSKAASDEVPEKTKADNKKTPDKQTAGQKAPEKRKQPADEDEDADMTEVDEDISFLKKEKDTSGILFPPPLSLLPLSPSSLPPSQSQPIKLS